MAILYRDEPALDINGDIIDFPANSNNSVSFRFKQHITGQTRKSGTKDVEIMVPLKYLSFEISLQLKWSKNCILVAGTAANKKNRISNNQHQTLCSYL